MAHIRILFRISKRIGLCAAPFCAVAIVSHATTEQPQLTATSEAVPFRVPFPNGEAFPPPPPPFPADILAKKLPSPPDNADLPRLDDLRDRLTLLNQFLDLPPDKLCQIRETIAAIEK